MNRRTRLLLTTMAIIGTAVLGDRGYRRWIEEPAMQRERQAASIEKQIREAEDIIFTSSRAGDQLRMLEQYSLPYNEELARARYQDWLLALVARVQLQQPSVDAGTPVDVSIKDRDTRKPKVVFRRYAFSIRGRGTLQQVTQLLFDFYQGGHLHKIRSLALNPVANGKQLDVNVSIEALGLLSCEREGELSGATAQRLAFKDPQAYQTIARRNLFSQAGAHALREIRLTAVVFDRMGTPGAWFSLGDNSPTQVVRRGETLEVASHQVRVIDIQSQLVLLEVDGEVIRMTLGKTIHELLAADTDSAASKVPGN